MRTDWDRWKSILIIYRNFGNYWTNIAFLPESLSLSVSRSQLRVLGPFRHHWLTKFPQEEGCQIVRHLVQPLVWTRTYRPKLRPKQLTVNPVYHEERSWSISPWNFFDEPLGKNYTIGIPRNLDVSLLLRISCLTPFHSFTIPWNANEMAFPVSQTISSDGSRICKREAKVERRRREYRSAKGAEGCGLWGEGFPIPTGSAPSPENFLTLNLNNRLLVHSERYFCSSATYCTSKKHCFWAYKTCCCSLHAMHSTETAKGGKHKPVGK